MEHGRYEVLTDFGEGNQLAAGLACLVDEVDGLLDTTLEIEPLQYPSQH